MISLPTSLVVAQWIVTLALAVILVIAFRQLAFLVNVEGKMRAEEGLPVGVTIPAFEYVSVAGEQRHFATGDMPLAILVADPLCVSCETALIALEKILDKRRSLPIRGLVVTSATVRAIDSVPRFRDTQVELALVRSEVLSDVLKTLGTPYTYIVDGEGAVASRGVAADEAAMEELIGLAATNSGSTAGSPVDGQRREHH
jgi:hypothetical protein